jgi:hypothetical protein
LHYDKNNQRYKWRGLGDSGANFHVSGSLELFVPNSIDYNRPVTVELADGDSGTLAYPGVFLPNTLA